VEAQVAEHDPGWAELRGVVQVRRDVLRRRAQAGESEQQQTGDGKKTHDLRAIGRRKPNLADFFASSAESVAAKRLVVSVRTIQRYLARGEPGAGTALQGRACEATARRPRGTLEKT
jgi:CHAD domain-containing protein